MLFLPTSRGQKRKKAVEWSGRGLFKRVTVSVCRC